MVACKSRIEERSLYRGQARDYGVVLSSGWRGLWRAREVLREALPALAVQYVRGSMPRRHFERELAALASTAEDGPTLHRFLKEDAGLRLVSDLMTHIRESLGERWGVETALAQLAEIDTGFLVRYQSYVFNESRDEFMERFVPNTLHHLAGLLLRFYDSHREAFDVEFRIAQVAPDFMGVLQHYGVVGTPGLDLTSDIDVALWFATHAFDNETNRYCPLPSDSWGYVYEARVPVVVWSEEEPGANAVEMEPLPFSVVNLANLSPLLTRIARQSGWYAVHGLGWRNVIDYGEAFGIVRRQAAEYGSPEAIRDRLAAKHLTSRFLFPPADQDLFKAFMSTHGVETFL